MPLLRPLLLAAILASTPAIANAAPVSDADAYAMTRPVEFIVSGEIAPDRLRDMLTPVEAFYGFWVNGDLKLLDQAVSPDFVDHTLPPGRPQGPSGPAAASKAFLAAVPDLSVKVTQRLMVGDRVVSHLRFAGHFTGTFAGRAGAGQTVDFIATDILKIHDGRITDNWHLEDNLTFLQQIGAVAR
jgi:predicted ester cyclase